MKLEGEGVLIRIFIGEADRWEGMPLSEAIVQRAREKGLAGATVLRGVEGFGVHSVVHTARLLRQSEDLPILIELVDRKEKIDAFLPELDSMLREGLVTMEPVQVVFYRMRDDSGRQTH